MKFKDFSSSGGKNFLRLKAGESVRGVFLGDPADFRQHWVNNRSSICAGRDKCELCKAGEKSAFRFRINLVIQENGAFVAKVFEQGKAVYEALKALNGDYDLETHQMKITRFGSGTETTYGITPVPNGTISDKQKAQIKEVKLNALVETPADQAEEVEQSDADEGDWSER